MGLLSGKKGIISGIANNRSIAWGVMQSILNEGGLPTVLCQNDRLLSKVERLFSLGSLDVPIRVCDLMDSERLTKTAQEVGEEGRLDYLVHSVAFANKEDLEGDFYSISQEGFQTALMVSCYSFVALVREFLPYLNEGASIVTMTYIGSQRAVPRYNVMGVAKAALESSVRYLANDLGQKGVRVNAVSAGPINTLAARGISNFTTMLKYAQEKSPMGRLTTLEDIGKASTFLLSSLSSGVTGAVLYVDCGLHSLL